MRYFPSKRRTVQPALTALCTALLFAAAAQAQPTVTAHVVSRFGTDTGGSCLAPCPVAVDASTSTSEVTGYTRFGEIKHTNVACTDATATLSCTGCFDHLNFEVVSISTNGATDWTASAGNVTWTEYFHDGGGTHGKPIAVRFNGVYQTEGTVGALDHTGAGRWAWGCHASDAGCTGTSVVYVLLPVPKNDPDAEATDYVEIVYGDGTIIAFSHPDISAGVIGFSPILTKVSKDAITITAGACGGSDRTNATIYPGGWTGDLRIDWSVTCTGSPCVEDVTRSPEDPRPNAPNGGAIDESKGHNDVWPFVLAPGFTQATITATVTDDVNGGSDTQSIVVTETAWSSTDHYADWTLGSDPTALSSNICANLGVDWFTSTGDAGACYYKAAPIATEPLTMAWNSTTRTKVACGSIANNQWCFGDVDSIGESRIYAQTTGSFIATATWADGSISNPWKSAEQLFNVLRTINGVRRGFLKRGETFTMAAPTNWSGESDETHITAYGSGAKPALVCPTGSSPCFNADGTNANIRLSDIAMSKASGAVPVVTFDGDKMLILRCDLSCAGGDDVLTRGIGHIARDTVVYDSTLTGSNSTGDYLIFDSGSANGIRRGVAYSTFVGQGEEPGIRAYNNNSAWVSNSITFTPATAETALRIAAGTVDADHNNVHGNYIEVGTDAGTCIEFFSDSTTDHDYVHVDSNYFAVQGITAVHNAIEWERPGSNLRIVNNVASGTHNITTVDVGSGRNTLVAHNNFRTNRTTRGCVEQSGAASWSGVRVLNNAIQFTTTNTGNYVLKNDAGNFDLLETSQVDGNIFITGGSGVTAIVEGVDYTTPALWTAASMKGGQVNVTDAPDWADPANDDWRPCNGSADPVAGCPGASPLIGSAISVASVYYDIWGQVRGSTATVGALIPEDATEGTCCLCDQSCTDTTEAACNTLNAVWTSGETCAVEDCTDTTGACCYTDMACAVITQECCTATGGTYAGDATTCAADCEGTCCTSTTCADTEEYQCADDWTAGNTCAGEGCLGKCCTRTGTCSSTNKDDCDGANTCDGAGACSHWTYNTACGTCPTIGCCKATTCSVLTLAACNDEGGNEAAADCSGTPCSVPDPDGSCCKTDGTCAVTTEAVCDAISGAIWTDGGVCSPNTCAPAWACCNGETCTTLTSAACTAASGTWLDTETCTPTNPCLLGVCCGRAAECTDGLRADECGLNEPFYTGATCAASPCFAVEACCFDAAACELISPDFCANENGAAQGAGSTCDPDCLGTCCTATFVCTDTEQMDCVHTWSPDQSCIINACADMGPPLGTMMMMGVGR